VKKSGAAYSVSMAGLVSSFAACGRVAEIDPGGISGGVLDEQGRECWELVSVNGVVV
jgi:hypothetical protein